MKEYDMKEYREYLNPTQKDLIQKLLRTFIAYIQEDEGIGYEGNVEFETYYNCYHFEFDDEDKEWESGGTYYYKYFELELQEEYKQIYNNPNQLELFVGV